MGLLNILFGALLAGITFLVPVLVFIVLIEENDKGEK